jgi:putative flippase GtrA
MKLLFRFVIISGVGWALDMTTFAALSQYFKMTVVRANFISSMVGVTYVWIFAIGKIFNRGNYINSIYLPVYWGYQLLSIIFYSAFLSFVLSVVVQFAAGKGIGITSNLIAKIIITIPNLLTNFIFMSILTKFMKTTK